MSQSPQMDPENQARFQSAALQEMEGMVQYLQSRVVALNVEIQIRDASLADVQEQLTKTSAELIDLRAQATPEDGEPDDSTVG